MGQRGVSPAEIGFANGSAGGIVKAYIPAGGSHESGSSDCGAAHKVALNLHQYGCGLCCLTTVSPAVK